MQTFPSKEGFFDLQNYNGTIGIAYAGNSVVGLTLTSALATCLGNLISHGNLPALKDIARFALELLQMYVKELGVTAGDRALCELALVGFCPSENRHKIYHLSPAICAGTLKYQLDSYDSNQADDFVLLLGSDKTRISNSINEFRTTTEKDISWWRAPKSVVSAEVKNSINPAIGGHLQMGIGDSLGFQIYSICEPSGIGATAYMSYLGLDVSSNFGQIGMCRIGMTGMI